MYSEYASFGVTLTLTLVYLAQVVCKEKEQTLECLLNHYLFAIVIVLAQSLSFCLFVEIYLIYKKIWKCFSPSSLHENVLAETLYVFAFLELCF